MPCVPSIRRLVPALLLATPLFTLGAQGRCGGERAGTPACDTTPAKLPFAPTGWKTVALDHFSMQATDVRKEAAYYDALMNWKVRGDDGTRMLVGLGDAGSVVMRGGYQAPPPPTPTPADTAGRGGRGGTRAPRRVAWDGFCFVITPWDTKNVRAALESRGLNPVAENDGKFESFHVKDPDGFDVQVSNGAPMASLAGKAGPAAAAAPFAPTNWKTVWLDHISFEVSNYKESAAFYSALLGWKLGTDEGSQNQCQIGDVGDIIIRRGGGGNRAGGAAATSPARRAAMGHIAFGITPFDPDQVKAELDKRGLTSRVDTGGRGDIHTAPYKSYHTTTPNGYDLQISATTKA